MIVAERVDNVATEARETGGAFDAIIMHSLGGYGVAGTRLAEVAGLDPSVVAAAAQAELAEQHPNTVIPAHIYTSTEGFSSSL